MVAVKHCNNGRDCHLGTKPNFHDNTGCQGGAIGTQLVNGVKTGPAGTGACGDCGAFRLDYPCTDRAFVYRHPEPVTKGAMRFYSNNLCSSTAISIGFSTDGINWNVEYLEYLVPLSSASPATLGEYVWKSRFNMASFQFFYVATGCGSFELYPRCCVT